jgi:hypothetical protein
MDGENIAAFFAPPMAELATVNGAAIYVHFDIGYIETLGGHFSSDSPTITCAATDVAGIVDGSTAVVRGVSYKVRPGIQKLDDGAVVLMRLEVQ